jgi:hypothetical protein
MYDITFYSQLMEMPEHYIAFLGGLSGIISGAMISYVILSSVD